MSLAIGSWLYDSSTDYSKSSKDLNSAMLKAMSSQKTVYRHQNMSKNNKIIDDTLQYKNNIDDKRNMSVGKKTSKLPHEFYWLIK